MQLRIMIFSNYDEILWSSYVIKTNPVYIIFFFFLNDGNLFTMYTFTLEDEDPVVVFISNNH